MTQLLLNILPIPLVKQLSSVDRIDDAKKLTTVALWSRDAEFTAPLSRMLYLLGPPNLTKKNSLAGSYMLGEKWWYYATKSNYKRLKKTQKEPTIEMALLCKYSSLHEHDGKFEHRWYLKTYSVEETNNEIIRTLLEYVLLHVPEAKIKDENLLKIYNYET